jgi:hypothetical protein
MALASYGGFLVQTSLYCLIGQIVGLFLERPLFTRALLQGKNAQILRLFPRSIFL